jgi:MYXO-CTERM domain-containing protein
MKRFIAALFVAACVIWHSAALACGAFAAPRTSEIEKNLPYLATEQVLLIWDSETEQEDFIREARFEKANQSFGFVVPTPSKPEVSGVKGSPFEKLRTTFPYENPKAPRGGSGDLQLGTGSAKGGSAEPLVVVLDEQRIGSFTAFTLSASDGGAFDKWLADNGFEMAPEAKPWIAHYIKLKFYFVAFRYEAADAGGTGMTSETVRIRFKTPNPYYPYLEPVHPKTASAPDSRLLLGWVVTRKPMSPVTAKAQAKSRWVRPWHDGDRQDVPSPAVVAAVGPELADLIPKSSLPLVVQPFRDTKVSREGYGDVLFVPGLPTPATPEELEARKSLLGVLDPGLIGEGSDPLTAAVASAPAQQPTKAPEPKKSGCSAAPGPVEAGGVWLLAVLAFALARRRRWSVLALLALGCEQKTATTDAGDAPAIVETEGERRQRVVLEVMSGRIPNDGIPLEPETMPPTTRLQVDLMPGTFEGGNLYGADRVLAGGLRPKVRVCWESTAARMKKPAPSTTIMVEFHFTVNVHGGVDKVDPPTVEPDGSIVPPEFLGCAQRSLSRVQFDEPNAPVRGTVKVRIKPDSGQAR